MGQIKLMSSLILVALFGFAIVMFAINFGIDNNSAINLGDDSDFEIYNASIRGDLNDVLTEVNSSSETFSSTTLDQGDQSASSGGQFKVTTGSAMGIATDTIRVGYKKVFGSDNGFGVFLTALLSILLFMAVSYAWKAWRGNPD